MHNSVKLLKVVAEAIEHCTKDQIKNHDDSNQLRKMIASAKARLTFRVRLCRTIPGGTAIPQGVESGCVLNTSNKDAVDGVTRVYAAQYTTLVAGIEDVAFTCLLFDSDVPQVEVKTKY